MNVWVVVVIIVIAVVSAIAQTIKNQQEKEQTPRRRPNNRENASGVKTGASDMDRFLQEIEKLRKRAADGGDEPKKPVSRPTKSTRAVPTVIPAKKPKRDAPTVPVSRRIEQLPTATIVPPPPSLSFPMEQPAPPPSVPMPSLDRPMVSKAQRTAPTTPFGRDLFAMLGNKQSLPMVIVLQEILGPPKSQRG
jgi:hypothetical protein